MKEYGADLKRQKDELAKKQESLDKKIRKRYEFLYRSAEPELLKKAEVPSHASVDAFTIEGLLFAIMRIEKAYAERTKQLNLFKD